LVAMAGDHVDVVEVEVGGLARKPVNFGVLAEVQNGCCLLLSSRANFHCC
jgi:hypothetical protein